MPGRNTIKKYQQDASYHIYNRGVEKRVIFQDQQDYSTFLTYLQDYLSPHDQISISKKLPEKTARLRTNNFSDEISLLAYCLMPNHFHLLIKQKGARSLDSFMNSLATRYTLYFNKKYHRVGKLYQGVYRAVLVSTPDQLLHLSHYIHKQALALPSLAGQGQPCSYPQYIGSTEVNWLHPEDILNHLCSILPSISYQSFLSQDESSDTNLIRELVIEEHED